MDDDEGEGQEDPEREHEHGSHQVDHVVPANNGLSSICFLILQCFDQRIRLSHPTPKTMKV